MKYNNYKQTFIEREKFKNNNALITKKNKALFKQYIIDTAKKYNISVAQVEEIINNKNN